MSSFTRQQLEQWLHTIEITSGRILDVGGSQKGLAGRLKRFMFSEYRVLDLPHPHENEKNREPDYVGDLNYFMEGTQNFDVAFCLEVMEYIWDPRQALMNINRFLKKEGILYISFPFVYPIHNPSDQDYLRYTPRGCIKLLTECGFEIIDEVPRVFMTNGFMEMVHKEQMKPARGIDHGEQGLLIKAKKI